MKKKCKGDDFKSVIMGAMICGYGTAIMCAFSLLSYIAVPDYLEIDSKGMSAPVKKAFFNNPKAVLLILFSSALVGALAQFIGRTRRKG